jgi:hypothetical protein
MYLYELKKSESFKENPLYCLVDHDPKKYITSVVGTTRNGGTKEHNSFSMDMRS